MVGKREAVRQEFTKRLLEAAVKCVSLHGINNVRARTVVEEADCALGTIYKCFKDFDDLLLRVNSRTLNTLGEALDDALTNSPDHENPLKVLALAYAEFARENLNLWLALFDHRMPPGVPVPNWHLEEHAALFTRLTDLLASSGVGLSAEAASIRARTYFAAIHGVVSISLQDRFIGVPQEELESELTHLAAQFA